MSVHTILVDFVQQHMFRHLRSEEKPLAELSVVPLGWEKKSSMLHDTCMYHVRRNKDCNYINSTEYA